MRNYAGAAAVSASHCIDRCSVARPAAKVVIVVAIGVMVVIVSAQVFCAMPTTRSIGWADEVSRLAFVASIFLAIPLGIRTAARISVSSC